MRGRRAGVTDDPSVLAGGLAMGTRMHAACGGGATVAEYGLGISRLVGVVCEP